MTPPIAPLSAPNAGVAVSQGTGALPAKPDARAKLHAAAQQFEAIFARQMLASARATDFGDDLFSSQGSQTFRQMQDERFADIAAQRGALGLGAAIEKQLSARLTSEGQP